MHISRIQVEEGFLSGLDLKLTPGLVAVIGARGTGKTSLIEVIRYVLAAKNYTEESAAQSLEHARSILEGGEASVTLESEFDDIIVTRSSEEESPRSTERFQPPIIFSQKEIETVGTSQAGRMTLLDGFLDNRAELNKKEAAIANSIRGLYKEIGGLESEISRTSTGMEQLPSLREQVVNLEKKSTEFQATSISAKEMQTAIEKIAARTAALAVKKDMLDRFEQQVRSWVALIGDSVVLDFGLQNWEGKADSDPLRGLRDRYQALVDSLLGAVEGFNSILEETDSRRDVVQDERIKLETESRTLRIEVEKLSEGAGAVSRLLAASKTKIKQLESIQSFIREQSEKLATQRIRRNSLLNSLEVIRNDRFSARQKVAKRLNKVLGPLIKVTVDKYGQLSDYNRAIAATLRGSGLKYTEIAEKISETVGPRELMQYVEEENFSGLAKAAGLPKDRAARAISVFREEGMGDILTCKIEDSLNLRLLDGVEYKDISALSAGQRCTVVLPIVLQHSDRIIVIDQPEDHIDNAFITETLIKALRSRSLESQIILSTHNANIPVLGGAKLVIQMISDGRNGSVGVCKPIDDPAAVEAITGVMEGGIAAFRDRATFYKIHGFA